MSLQAHCGQSEAAGHFEVSGHTFWHVELGSVEVKQKLFFPAGLYGSGHFWYCGFVHRNEEETELPEYIAVALFAVVHVTFAMSGGFEFTGLAGAFGAVLVVAGGEFTQSGYPAYSLEPALHK